ncbi:hypothetical protein BGZ58_005831 [Dissophora ornata]|nr:hypothetical protein BGZ58_005831 [Dissophora ornata]
MQEIKRKWRFKCSDRLNSLPQCSILQVNTRLEESGFRDALRRAFAGALDRDEPEDEDELEALDVREAMEATELMEEEEAVASMGALSIGRDPGPWMGSKSSWDCVMG